MAASDCWCSLCCASAGFQDTVPEVCGQDEQKHCLSWYFAVHADLVRLEVCFNECIVNGNLPSPSRALHISTHK